jgi:pimeloyl-ACP methyl ester carboxylesterase
MTSDNGGRVERPHKPGGHPGDSVQLGHYQARHPYAPGRDLILLDQRGTGRSEPQLCPELTAKTLEADIAAVADMTEAYLARIRAMYLARNRNFRIAFDSSQSPN